MAIFSGKLFSNTVVHPGDDVTTLTSVVGTLLIKGFSDKENGVQFPMLEAVYGDLSVRTEGVSFPSLEKVTGSLFIEEATAGIDFPMLTLVGGWLCDYSKCSSLPALVSIGKGFRGRYKGKTDLPSLTLIAGKPLPPAEEAMSLLKKIAEIVVANPSLLTMNAWHSGEAHCIAGWAVHLSGDKGYALENELSDAVHGKTAVAGTILLGIEASRLFFLPKERALAELEALL